ncbi:MAG: hypothetical protein A4S17_12550 [Proteobacteria bacterium HN_bin10]|nr:MAG: hypothetical protein A4S17_12550 [Proteobacteria bacterium HN_bin10]
MWRMNEAMRIWLSAVATLALSACASTATPTEGVTRVVSTTSFGMCVGYCTTRLEISEGEAVLIRQARGGRGAPQDLPDQRTSRPLTTAEWQDIQRLAARADFEAMPDVVGCPDCADGGAEGLVVESAGETESVSFEHGASLASAQPLLNRVRALRAQLTPEEAR